jgi:superfamily II DNA/RNA helicase
MPSNMAEDQNYYYSVLQRAREQAAATRRYDSLETRALVASRLKPRFNNKIPYEWQQDVNEAVLCGLDVTLIAGTGSGKTLPFVLPLLASDTGKKMVLIISPLKELQKDMVRELTELDSSYLPRYQGSTIHRDAVLGHHNQRRHLEAGQEY